MVDVISKKDVQTVSDPHKRDIDPWADFRLVERLNLEFTQNYTHSLGKYSRFFVELENSRFMATRCETCEGVYAPPRPLCPQCLRVTQWVELPGTGTVETYSVLHFSPGSNADVEALKTPYILAYVLLDGSSTLFPHILDAPPDIVQIGMRVRVHYVDRTVFHPLHLMYFVPVEG
ncbi:MAG: Zn-ribbon domain-containing OB-fold protein [Burkholderiales bacterium]|nr:Zn-ribbon domain-containing OB-fold protein [Anaerolineae bacterium]